jgi:hypothetical protein
MHKFLIYLSIYFCLTCFGLSFSPSSEAGVQLRQWFKSPGYGVSARVLTPYPGNLHAYYVSWLLPGLEFHTCNIPTVVYAAPPEDEQLVLETCTGH